MKSLHCIVALGCFSLCTNATSADANWPRWRGADGTGISTEAELPVTWSSEDVAWKTSLPGVGQSSPIVWGDRIFLTSALDGGRERQVLCVSRDTGEILWTHTAWTGDPEVTHKMNNRASSTCACDGEHVVAFFGRGGLHCYDLSGELLWSRDLGAFEGPWGTGASPIIVGDLVVQNCDADDKSYLLAVDKRTGKDVWKTERFTVRGWSTPILIEAGGRKELVINGHTGINAYDPATGKELWFCKGDRGRGTPTVARYNDIVIAVSGRPGAMFAVRTGGNGAVNETHEVWRTQRRGGRDLPSPIVVGDYLVVASLNPGIISCYEAGTGKLVDKIRVDGNFSASPFAANGLIYLPNEAGKTFVLRAGRKLEVVATNSIDPADNEVFRASLTPSRGQILSRSDRVLYCIGK